MTHEVMNRKHVRAEVAAGLSGALAGAGKPVSSVYDHKKGSLAGESPVVLVLSGPIDRTLAGVGTRRFENGVMLELHLLVYDGDSNNPLSEKGREDALDDINYEVAKWLKDNQRGVYYRALRFAGASEVVTVKMTDGNPYLLEVINLEAEAPDYEI